jgi:hypothetical protein
MFICNIFEHLSLHFIHTYVFIYSIGYKIELTAEEQAMSYPGQLVEPEDAGGGG